MTRRVCSFACVALFVMGSGGTGHALAQQQQKQEPPKQRAAPKRTPVPDGVKVERDVPYVRGGGPRQTLDIYVPEYVQEDVPVVVWVHGGGWQNGSKDGCPAVPLATRGYVVASINYRLTDLGPFPAQIEDCRAAIRFLRGNAARYHIDTKHIGVWGASAGGHLVALLGTAGDEKEWDDVGEFTDQSARVQAVCDYFGPADFSKFDAKSPRTNATSGVGKLLGGALADKQAEARKASPVSYASKDDPPFLIVHGDQDPLVPLAQSEVLLQTLKDAGVDAALLVVKNGKHGQFTADCEPKPAEIRDTVFGFFDKNLKKPGTSK